MQELFGSWMSKRSKKRKGDDMTKCFICKMEITDPLDVGGEARNHDARVSSLYFCYNCEHMIKPGEELKDWELVFWWNLDGTPNDTASVGRNAPFKLDDAHEAWYDADEGGVGYRPVPPVSPKPIKVTSPIPTPPKPSSITYGYTTPGSFIPKATPYVQCAHDRNPYPLLDGGPTVYLTSQRALATRDLTVGVKPDIAVVLDDLWIPYGTVMLTPHLGKMLDLTGAPEYGDKILIEWPDMKVPVDVGGAKWVIGEVLKMLDVGAVVEIGCQGGHGRTGTLAAWMTLELAKQRGLGMTDVEVIDRVRELHCVKAIETWEQEDFLYEMNMGVKKEPRPKPVVIKPPPFNTQGPKSGPQGLEAKQAAYQYQNWWEYE